MAGVRIHDVTKSFGAIDVIRGISVDIPDGAFVALVGPSGCGKSTLLRMVAGLEEVSSGQIEIGGRIVNDVPPKARDIAMVFQNYALYPHMNVAENMSFSLKLQGCGKAEIATKVARAAQILSLEPFLDRYPRQLSGGQRQRVAMGRAIVRDPAVFLFDEPLSNLDAKLRVQMRAEMKELHQRLATTTLYVTHDQVEAMTMADLVVVLNGGRVEQVGSPLDLYDKPNNRFVAGFIGSPSMNFLRGQIEVERTPHFVMDGQIRIPLSEATPSAWHGRDMVLGVRPEHLSLGAEIGISARISVVEPTGSETHVTARVGDQDLVGLFRERLALKPGTDISLAAAAANLHLFDPTSGQRVGH